MRGYELNNCSAISATRFAAPGVPIASRTLRNRARQTSTSCGTLSSGTIAPPVVPLLAASVGMTVFVGAVSFYLSDVFVARDRFLKSEFVNRLIGLPMYYCGQFLLAFSVGLLK